jgi:VIT1/CCC1 family predicted Fe2+/Mn2+ transporter
MSDINVDIEPIDLRINELLNLVNGIKDVNLQEHKDGWIAELKMLQARGTTKSISLKETYELSAKANERMDNGVKSLVTSAAAVGAAIVVVGVEGSPQNITSLITSILNLCLALYFIISSYCSLRDVNKKKKTKISSNQIEITEKLDRLEGDILSILQPLDPNEQSIQLLDQDDFDHWFKTIVIKLKSTSTNNLIRLNKFDRKILSKILTEDNIVMKSIKSDLNKNKYIKKGQKDQILRFISEVPIELIKGEYSAIIGDNTKHEDVALTMIEEVKDQSHRRVGFKSLDLNDKMVIALGNSSSSAQSNARAIDEEDDIGDV